MKKVFWLLCVLFVGCSHKTKDDASVCLGDVLWEELQKEELEYNLDTVIDTLRANAKGDRTPEPKPLTRLSKHTQKLYEKKAVLALETAEKFLKGLAQQKEYRVLENGQLLVRILEEGTGTTISQDSTPLLHFTERDLDGDILYDTRRTNVPLPVPLKETILGLQKGITGMRIGERREIYIHPNLAYKHLGKTKPNQLIILDVTMMPQDIESKDPCI